MLISFFITLMPYRLFSADGLWKKREKPQSFPFSPQDTDNGSLVGLKSTDAQEVAGISDEWFQTLSAGFLQEQQKWPVFLQPPIPKKIRRGRMLAGKQWQLRVILAPLTPSVPNWHQTGRKCRGRNARVLKHVDKEALPFNTLQSFLLVISVVRPAVFV